MALGNAGQMDVSDGARRVAKFTARCAFGGAFAATVLLVITVAATWFIAWQYGRLPDAQAYRRYEQSGSGPWNHDPLMSAYVDCVFNAAALTLVSGVLVCIVCRKPAQRWFGGLACAAALASAWYHFYLID